jgi:short-subunit dehydrogenase
MPSVAVITGASSGIGWATAARLAREPDARLILVARRLDRLRQLAGQLPCPVTCISADLTAPDAPERVRQEACADGRSPNVLVNNAGAGFAAPFAQGGYANVARTMAINFDAVVRLTEAMLPVLRDSAPSSIVNVSSSAGRVTRAGTGAYSASKAALSLWTDALALEERAHGVHVGLVQPGFIPTEGFPQNALLAHRVTRWMMSTPERAAEVIAEVILKRQPERYVPWFYGLFAGARLLTPALVRRVLSGPLGAAMSSAAPTNSSAAGPSGRPGPPSGTSESGTSESATS